jgi:hypothetical protein
MPVELANEHENRLSYSLVIMERMFANDSFSVSIRWSNNEICRIVDDDGALKGSHWHVRRSIHYSHRILNGRVGTCDRTTSGFIA